MTDADTGTVIGPPAQFDVCGALPVGTTVLEASAGTGKTFTIAALATRYVAEGTARLHELMLVTFGRAATQELRERVRERLVATERGLADPEAARSGPDTLLAHLAAVPDAEVIRRRQRVAAALADFDAATIATTHGFCLQMLTGLGVAADLDAGASFVESVDDLVVEVVQDLYLRKYGRPGSPVPLLTYPDALEAVRGAVRDPQSIVEPSAADPDSPAGLRVGIARAARTEVAARKRRRRLVDYDDLVSRLHAALADPDGGPAARQRVRGRFRVVLVDEFQDTDPLQWQILRLAFHGHTTLVLIGDPKQAIYAFRGGDVIAYLHARADASTTATLGTCWRSDGGLLTALEHVFGEAALGHRDIVVRPVSAAYPQRRLQGGSDAPLRLRVVRREQTDGSAARLATVAPVRDLISRDLADDVVRLLGSRTRLSVDGGPRPVAPGDIAVLVHRNATAVRVRDVLAAAGVPAVLSGAVNVFSTEMARVWLRLLLALEQPQHTGRVRAAALGCFVGWDATRLAGGTSADSGTDTVMDQLRPLLRGWSELLARRGVPALLEAATGLGLTSRLLRTDDGERALTDLRHIAQALHAAAVGEQLGTAALVEWLQRRIADADKDPSEEGSRRLESDAAAVQVVTVHRSKGLEFPVVYVPFGWDRFKPKERAVVRLHDRHGARVLDIGGPNGPGRAANQAGHDAEESGEDLRLLYVAMTRAQCQVVTWWAPSTTTAASPLNRLLLGGHLPGAEPPAAVAVPSDEAVAATFAALAARSGGSITVEPVHDGSPARWRPPAAAPAPLAAASLRRHLDTGWRRTSYTALTSAAHEAAAGAAHGTGPSAGAGDEPEARVLADEPAAPAGSRGQPNAPDAALLAVRSPMADLPTGAGFGIVVHSVLEQVDTGAADLAAVSAAFETQARREARGEVRAYLDATAPAVSEAATRAYDTAPDRAAAIAAARAVVAQQAPRALRAFPQPARRYELVEPPTPNIEALRRYLDGTQALPDGRQIYGALNIRRVAGDPVIEYWSTNLSHDEPSNIARRAMRLEMQREALAAQGLAPTEADRLDGFDPAVAQFDPRPSAGEGQVTIRDRAPFYAALALAFILWSVVFSVANMLLTGVIEEKSNKILDTLLTSVSPIELLTGKLLGVALVSLTLFLFWGVLGGTLLSIAAERANESILGQVAAAFLEPRLLVAFVVGFIAGYLMYGAIFLSLGSLCESIQEAQTLLGPVALILAIPMLLITPALDNPNAPIIEAASWIPIFTPFLLLVRAPSGLDWIEIAGMGGVMIVAVIVILWLAARVFRAGVVDQVSMANWRGRKAKG